MMGWPFPFRKFEKSPFNHSAIGTLAWLWVPCLALVLCSLKKKNVLLRPS